VERIRLAVASAVADTFMWQIAASVVIPGFVINRAVSSTERLVDAISQRTKETQPNSAGLSRAAAAVLNKPAFKRFAPTAVGLSLIPLISTLPHSPFACLSSMTYPFHAVPLIYICPWGCATDQFIPSTTV
jgi:hypothetical protein